MARKKIDIKKIIKVYLKKFPKDIKVKGVFLFGSYVRGEAGKHSDVDIIIISPDFNLSENVCPNFLTLSSVSFVRPLFQGALSRLL